MLHRTASFASTPDLGFDMLLKTAELLNEDNHTDQFKGIRMQTAVDAYMLSMHATVGQKV